MHFIFDASSSVSKDREEVSSKDFSLRLLQKFRWITHTESEQLALWLTFGGASNCRKICKTLQEKLLTQSYEVITEREEAILL